VRRIVGALGAALALAACATSPLGRSQLRLFPDAEMSAMGVAAFDKMKTEMPRSTDPRANGTVRCVATAVTGALTGAWAGRTWEIVVFEDSTANAFALPGGKIGVHTGLLKVASNQDQLATVIGHEVAHVLAEHANERVSTAYAAQGGVQLVEILTGASSPTQRQLLALLGAGAQLPFSRAQEAEADLLGLDAMARAGFDPRESVNLWRNMAASGGAKPPELLSTHPSDERRMAALAERVPSAMKLYEAARSAGRRPSCS